MKKNLILILTLILALLLASCGGDKASKPEPAKPETKTETKAEPKTETTKTETKAEPKAEPKKETTKPAPPTTKFDSEYDVDEEGVLFVPYSSKTFSLKDKNGPYLGYEDDDDMTMIVFLLYDKGEIISMNEEFDGYKKYDGFKDKKIVIGGHETRKITYIDREVPCDEYLIVFKKPIKGKSGDSISGVNIFVSTIDEKMLKDTEYQEMISNIRIKK